MPEQKRISFRNGPVELSALLAGPADGPLLILLHGFPEFSYGWRRQIGPLAEAGFLVAAPDGRGYNQSSKRPHVVGYSLPFLAADVIALADHLGRETFFLAGHDWGAAVAWHTAAHYPNRVDRLVILNAPHPNNLFQFLLRHPKQLLRSWYMLFFQLPALPELLFALGNYRGGVEGLVRSSRPGTFSSADLEQYRAAWSKPGALTGMISWYRALFRYRRFIRFFRIEPPTLILWGMRDRFLLPQLARESLKACRDANLVYFPDASHWLQHEEPEEVNAHIIRFLRS